MRSHGAWERFAAGLLLLAGLSAAGCSSGPARPPYPADPDPCASYCLKWVPPEYRPVAKFCPCPGRMVCDKVPVEKVVFEEVCRPNPCKTVCIPDQCRRYGAVEVEPGRTEWVAVNCTDPCTCCDEKCWKPVYIPPKYKWCEKCETIEGYKYCYTPPPEYDVVAKTCRTCQSVNRYVPGGATATVVQELYSPGHWAWEKRYDCRECKTCPKPPDCAPMGPPCPEPDPCPCGTPVKGDFRRAPGQ